MLESANQYLKNLKPVFQFYHLTAVKYSTKIYKKKQAMRKKSRYNTVLREKLSLAESNFKHD